MNSVGAAIDTDQANILVVDDLPEKHLAYEAVLDGLGCNIVSVHSGAEALKQMLQQDFAVILLDVNMPGMDGFETAQLIRQRKRFASTPIIFLTAFADEVRTAQGYATGAVDYLPTPVVPEILKAKVRVFVELFEMRRQMARQAEAKAKQAAMQEANRRLAFLADAGAVLGRSLDIQATARDIVRLPIPFLADTSILKLNPIVGEANQILTARMQADEIAVQELEATDPIPADVADAIDRVMTSARLEFVADGDSESSGIVLPLHARGRTFAVLALVSESSPKSFDANDLTIAEALSSRAAIALDNALLHEEIRRADRQKNDFLSMLAHELRNPLAPIQNAAQLLEIRVPEEPEVKWACEVIDRQVVQMVRLVDDLLDVARITRDKIRLHCEPVKLQAVVECAVEASRPLIDLRRHQFYQSLCPSEIWIDGDLARLTQVLTNLLNNAAKFTEEGGNIWLTTAVEGDTAIIKVRDTGIGIPPQMLDSVFELFTQVDRALDRSHGGLGIGLTLVKRLVEMHGGTVSAQSDGPGHGSEFTISLPAILQSESVKPAGLINGTTRNARPLRILVVDDNRDSARTLSMMLHLMGHESTTAHDGQEAIAMATTFQPDIILLDIGLPKLNGYEVCQRLRAQFGDTITIAALTGWGQEDDRRRSNEAGFDVHLVKPIELSALQTLLANAKPSSESGCIKASAAT